MGISKYVLRIFAAIIASVTCSMVQAEQPSSATTAKYVSIDVAIHGFEDSAQILNSAVTSLAQTVEEISQSPEDLNSEQIEAVTELARETNQVVMSFRQVLLELPEAVGNLRYPAEEVAMSFAVSARENAIDPVINSIDNKVTIWIRIVFIGLILLFIIAGIALFNIAKQLKATTHNLKQIADQYTIIRKDALPEVKQ